MDIDLNSERQAVAVASGEQLARTADRMQAADGAVERLSIMAADLAALGPRLCEISPRADISLSNGLGDEAVAVADALGRLKTRCQANDPDTLQAAVDLSIGLSGLSAILVQYVGTFKLPCADKYTGDVEPGRVTSAVERATQLAFDMSMTAESIFDASGAAIAGNSVAFDFAVPPSTCCGEAQTPPPLDVPAGDGSTDTTPLPFDEPGLVEAIILIDAFVNALIELLEEFAILIVAFLGISCDAECTRPFSFSLKLLGSGATGLSGGAFQPFITLQWDYCCQNSCWGQWKDVFIVSNVATVTYNFARTFPVGRKRAAMAFARKMGAKALVRVNGGFVFALPGVKAKPPLVPPPAPVC